MSTAEPRPRIAPAAIEGAGARAASGGPQGTRSRYGYVLCSALLCAHCGSEGDAPRTPDAGVEAADGSALDAGTNVDASAATPLTIELLPVRGGEFSMGSSRAENEGPVRQVVVSDFAMSRIEVTQGQFRSLMGHNPSEIVGDELPVAHVSWYDALRFANALSELTGREPAYRFVEDSPVPDTPVVEWNRDANGFRLPTEAEWEYAARGGSNEDTYGGDLASGGGVCASDETLESIAWYCANASPGGSGGGLKQPNPFGLYDMIGNVWEWVWDFEPDFVPLPYEAVAEPVVDPSGRDGNGVGARVLRGGSWMWPPAFQRSAARIAHVVNELYTHTDFGFRVVGPAEAAGTVVVPPPADTTEHGHGEPVEPDDGLTDLVYVPAGTFSRSSSGSASVSSFLMTRTEVTQGQYYAVLGENPSHIHGSNLPVLEMNWYDVARFANALSVSEGLTPAYVIREGVEDLPGQTPTPEIVTWVEGADGYRLPTEAEWELAARAGTTTSTYAGNRTLPTNRCGADPILERIAWYCHNADLAPHPVGELEPNDLGLFDMLGNASEWVWDWNGPLPAGSATDPRGPAAPVAGRFKVVRGGSFLGAPTLQASGARGNHIINAYYGHHDYGIRLVRAATPQSVRVEDFEDGSFEPLVRSFGPRDDPATSDPAFTAEVEDGELVLSGPAAAPGPRLSGFLDLPSESTPIEGPMAFEWTFTRPDELQALAESSSLSIAGLYLRGEIGAWVGGTFGDLWVGMASSDGSLRSVIRRGADELVSVPLEARGPVRYRVEKRGTEVRLFVRDGFGPFVEVGRTDIVVNEGRSASVEVMHVRVLDTSGREILVHVDDFAWTLWPDVDG